MSYCNVCADTRKVWLPTRLPITAIDMLKDDLGMLETGSEEFDCPKCSMVPYRRVRAMKVATAYEAEQFAKYQAPIERGLAARFGEYLMREGLIRFSTSGSSDLGAPADKITITAHLGVVARQDVVKAEAVEEVALTAAPPLPPKLTRQQRERVKVSSRAVRWSPPPLGEDPEPAPDEFVEATPRNRFSELDL